MFLPGEPQGRQSLVGCRLWGRTESDTTEATQQQQQNAGSKALDLYSSFIQLNSCVTLVKTLGEGNGTPLQYSCLENPIDGGAW